MEVSLQSPDFGSNCVFFVVYFRMLPVTLIIASSWSTTDDGAGKDLEGGGRSITEVLSQHVLWVCEENYGKPHSRLPMTRPIFQLRFSKIQILERYATPINSAAIDIDAWSASWCGRPNLRCLVDKITALFKGPQVSPACPSEDEDEHEVFVEQEWLEKTEALSEKLVPVPFCQTQTPYGLVQSRTRPSVVRDQRWKQTNVLKDYSRLFREARVV